MRKIILPLLFSILLIGISYGENVTLIGWNTTNYIPLLTTSEGRLLININLANFTANILCLNNSCISDWQQVNQTTVATNMTGVAYMNRTNAGDFNLTGKIGFPEGTGVKKLLFVNGEGLVDGFSMEYWYDFELANDDWMVFKKTDGNDDAPDGGIAFMMSNASNNNRTIIKLDGYGLANFTDYSIRTRSNITSEGKIFIGDNSPNLNNMVLSMNTGGTYIFQNDATTPALWADNDVVYTKLAYGTDAVFCAGDLTMQGGNINLDGNTINTGVGGTIDFTDDQASIYSAGAAIIPYFRELIGTDGITAYLNWGGSQVSLEGKNLSTTGNINAGKLVAGNLTITQNASLQNLTVNGNARFNQNVNIQNLTVTNVNGDLNVIGSLQSSNLTATRILYAGTNGKIVDSPNLTFNGGTQITYGTATTNPNRVLQFLNGNGASAMGLSFFETASEETTIMQNAGVLYIATDPTNYSAAQLDKAAGATYSRSLGWNFKLKPMSGIGTPFTVGNTTSDQNTMIRINTGTGTQMLAFTQTGHSEMGLAFNGGNLQIVDNPAAYTTAGYNAAAMMTWENFGGGIGINTTNPLDKVFEVNFPTRMTRELNVTQNVNIDGNTVSKGNATFVNVYADNLNISTTAVINQHAIIKNLTVTNRSYFNENVQINKNLSVNGLVAIGTGGVFSGYALEVQQTKTTAAAGNNPMNSFFMISNAPDVYGYAPSAFSVTAQAANPSGIGNRMNAFLGTIQLVDGITNIASGGTFQIQTLGGNATYAYGFDINSPYLVAGNIGIDAGMHIGKMGGTGVTTGIGLYMDAQSGSSYRDYAIYSAGGDSVHKGSIKIGQEADPAYTLDVTGTASITGATTLGSTLSVTGNSMFSNNLTVLGNVSFKRYYWDGYDNSTQSLISTSDAQVINISNNNDYSSYGINVEGKQNLTFEHTGVYLCVLSPEFYEPTGQSGVITFWYQKTNSTGQMNDIAWSNSRYTLSSNTYSAPAITYQFKINSVTNDKVRFMWWSDNANTIIYSSGALTSPTRPSIPGILLNCQKVSEVT